MRREAQLGITSTAIEIALMPAKTPLYWLRSFLIQHHLLMACFLNLTCHCSAEYNTCYGHVTEPMPNNSLFKPNSAPAEFEIFVIKH